MQDWNEKYLTFKQKKTPAKNKAITSQSTGSGNAHPTPQQKPVDLELKNNLQTIQEILGDNGDLVVRNFRMYGLYDAAIVFFFPLIDEEQIHEHVLKPLMNIPSAPLTIPTQLSDLPNFIWNITVHIARGSTTSDLNTLPISLVEGNVILFIDGVGQALTFNLRKNEHRSIEAPQTELTIRGSREGFIENLEANISLIRYRLQTPDFRVQTCPLGTRSRSQVALCYIEGIANPALIKKVMKRLSAIHTDSIIDAGYIEQFIEDQPLSPFPQVQSTERPDKSTAALLEGRAIILVDGSPFSLIVPALFNQFFQTIDDYTERFIVGSLIRLIRLVALIFSLFFPALYVSIISFNPELLPTEFAVALSGGRAGVPLPALLEVLVMEVFMEVLREATIRLPQMIGGALSIVGVLVIGQAAVAAGLASPTTVVVVALTTIGSFATPSYSTALALRMLRFPLIVLAGCFGLYGVMIGTLVIINHLLFLESFGVPYMTPYVPFKTTDMKDSVIRAPLWWMKQRPSFLNSPNSTRLAHQLPKAFSDLIFKDRGDEYE
ncbi:spore germination protein [Paenibacillus monticola]|uniref:Spore germination protein n=1 Tax=Paenibacillus monticola TaxID=2666075 RepID=A0A7X2L130_9BACL|nr:spore germination protein [Paenibacillus monticola]MRN51906.1 spore germination protein [Paenibacillus monticola]